MIPDKIYVCAAHPSPFWFSDKQIPNMIEYICKDALLEWLRKTKDEALNEVPMLDVLTLQKVIDKLNSM